MENTVLSIITLVVIIGLGWSQRYRRRKHDEYRNDERWQAIQAKVNRVVLKYYRIIGQLIAIGLIVLMFFTDHHNHLGQIQVGLGYALIAGAFLIMASDVVEVIAFKYFDNRM